MKKDQPSLFDRAIGENALVIGKGLGTLIPGISVERAEEISEYFRNTGYLLVDDREIEVPEITLTVLGEPKAQKRHRSVRMGTFVRQYDPSAADKGDFLSVVQAQAPSVPLSCPIRLDIAFYFSRPRGHYGSGKNKDVLKPSAPTWHTGKPDSDNIQKFVFDALNKIYWKDDGCICNVSCLKQYSDQPRTEIKIYLL